MTNSTNWIVDLTLVGLLLLSVATWSIMVIKLRGFRGASKLNQAFLDAFGKERDWSRRIEMTHECQGEFARLAQKGFQTCRELGAEEGQAYDSHDIRELLERELQKQLQSENRRRERGLVELASIGSTSPFIGLFGTVWGIMNALVTISATGQASIDVVAGPIGEALIATAVGIAAAVPAVLAYNYFVRQQRVFVGEISEFGEDLIRYAMRNRQQWGQSC